MMPIFSDNLLLRYISDFRLSSVTNIRGITLLIKGLIEELDSGKINSLKEEEFKSRFLTTFFGDILGFNCGNSNKWLLKEEKKSVVGRSKPDGALGYFFVYSDNDKVKAVIEVKKANIDLDKKQSNRSDHLSPVDQAFGYAPKSGGNCKWVIVSNIKEIRFYPSDDRSKCQVFFLKELENRDKLKELLFLFHKDRFIKETEKSSTDKLFEQSKKTLRKEDKTEHIIDKIYNSLKRFEGFRFVDPNFIATIYPFNILEERVWHYDAKNLFTINKDFYNFLNGIYIENNHVNFTDELSNEILTSNVVDAKHKVEWIFTFLNHSMIHEITAIKDYKQVEAKSKAVFGLSYKHSQSFPFREGEEGITKNIYIIKGETCDCVGCNYRNLNFNKMFRKLKAAEGNKDQNTAEYAYGNYLTASNNYKTTYTIYKAIEIELKGKQDKGIEYFLTKKNMKNLQSSVWHYQLDDRQVILDDIKSIDLDKVLYDEIEFDVDKDVKKYLIDVKQDVLIYKIQDEIEEIAFKIEKLNALYKNGGKQSKGPDLPKKLSHQYYLLYGHINRNYIVYDDFYRYKSLTEKVFKGLVESYYIPQWGITSFSEFFLTEAILHIFPSSLKEILKKEENLKVRGNGVEKLLGKLNNFTSSIFEDGLFSDPLDNELVLEHFNNITFSIKFNDIFANLFTVFSKLEISKNQFSKCVNPLLKFLKVTKKFDWFSLKELSNFIFIKGNLFVEKDLMEILKLAINGDKYGYNKYNDLIEAIVKANVKFYPTYKIDNVKLVQQAILNCSSENGINIDYTHLVYLPNVCNDSCKQILFNAFEIYLDKRFNYKFYQSLIRITDYDYNSKNYFQLYSETINQWKSRTTKFGSLKLTGLIFINYVFVVYKLNIDFNRNELQIFTNLNDFESWLLNPLEFDYKKFDAIWLTDLNRTIIPKRLKGNINISRAIESQLGKEFNPILAELKYKFFSVENDIV